MDAKLKPQNALIAIDSIRGDLQKYVQTLDNPFVLDLLQSLDATVSFHHDATHNDLSYSITLNLKPGIAHQVIDFAVLTLANYLPALSVRDEGTKIVIQFPKPN